MKEQKFRFDTMTMGTCYYPEHWPEEHWANDLDRILANGISDSRIAEFAWSQVELHEGQFIHFLTDSLTSATKRA